MGETGIRKTEYGISKRLFLTLTMVLSVLVWGITLQGLTGFALLNILTYISIEDLQTRIISNRHIAAILGLWLVQCVTMAVRSREDILSIISQLIGAAAIFVVLQFIRIKAAGKLKSNTEAKVLGGGDIKLLAVLSLFLGAERSLYMMFTACLLAITCLAVKKSSMTPLGPFIAIASALYMMV